MTQQQPQSNHDHIRCGQIQHQQNQDRVSSVHLMNNSANHSNIFTIQTDTNVIVHGLQQIHPENTRRNENNDILTNQWTAKPSLFNFSRLKFRMNINETNAQNSKLPEYQLRHNKMVKILREYETLPLYLVTGFIREIGIEQIDQIIIPQDLINLCFKFYQHQAMAKLIDSKDNDELYSIAWEATEKEDYLFAEQIINYLLKYKMSAATKNETLARGGNNNYVNDNRFKINNNNTNSTNNNNHNGNKSISRCSTSEDASTTNLMAVIKYFMKDYKESEIF